MIEYVLTGAGVSVAAFYTLYCHSSFYNDLKKTVIKRLAEYKDRNRTLEDVFKEDGVYMYSHVQPREDIGTFFLKPTIHLTKVLLMHGGYDRLAEEYARKKGISPKNVKV